jgi:two-component system CheB/CheR fusion protein
MMQREKAAKVMAKKQNGKKAGKESAAQKESHIRAPGFHIAAIGASAGGLNPLKAIFSSIKPDNGIAYVVISHLDPHHATMLPELLQKSTNLSVKEITDGMVIEPDCVYVIAPDNMLTIKDGRFQLEKRASDKIAMPINIFLKSLAEQSKDRAIAVILSGTGTDGAAGLKAIKEHFGVVVVQNPDSAQYKGMPSAAIATGLADEVFEPEQIPEFLADYVIHRKKRLSKAEKVINPSKIDIVCKLLHRRTGHDFSGYKHNTIIRRIGRRLDLHRLENVDHYIRFLQENPQEVDALFGELLIGVTNFFRDAPAWEVIHDKVLPIICNNKPHESAIRIWIPGASTGEEAYSMAILLQEYMDEYNLILKPTIFATDIDETAVEKARKGVYPAGIETDLSKERLSRYFARQDNSYVISRNIRETVIFAPQNLLKDPPFSKLDLICCRNVLIYMDSTLQRKILPLFHYSLNPGGVLFLGSSESIGDFDDMFTMIDSKWKIYRRRVDDTAPSGVLDFPLAHALPEAVHKHVVPTADINKWMGQKLLEEFVPASVIIDYEGNIQYFHGRTGRYFEPAPGQAKWDVYEMARSGLKTALRAAVHQAVSQNTNVSRDRVRIKTNGDYIQVRLEVRPFGDGRKLLMVTFREIAEDVKSAAKEPEHDKYYGDLEQELKDTRENLQSTVEELETSNEELRSMNEEYQSTNEELKSANEELETSREELQSLNEELTTVNNELQDKINGLSEAQKEMQMFLDSLDIPTLFLDDELRIVRFTVQAAKIFHIIESDIGRPIQHFASNFNDDSFIEEAKEVLKTLRQMEKEVCTTDDHWYLRRTLPYRTADSRIRGVAINFVDIHQIKSTVEELEKSRIAAQSLARVIDEPLVILNKDFCITMASDSFCRQFSFSREQIENKIFFEIGDGLMNKEEL